MWKMLWLAVLAAGCGGGSGECSVEGEGWDAKAKAGTGAPCCEGLTPANVTHAPDADGVCQIVDINPVRVCIACGDGTCGPDENGCNCPEDCGEPAPTCVPEGDGYDVKALIEGPCCEGLTPANTSEAPDADGVCQVLDIESSKVCIACGDGACGTAENACNCPADCG